MGEGILPYVLICRDFEEFKNAATSVNTQQQANRIVNAVVQQLMMEPHHPLGNDAPIRSQVGEENRNSGRGRTPAAHNLRDRPSLIGVVENASASNGAAGLVVNRVESALVGLSTQHLRNDVISCIERTQDC